ncbi:hypothetical protein [Lentzea sp. HUAS12]|uniref:hypothetical protein n=1 Tax=Lentzea sp. HUAS12 TaxID=2951806 RepID=UPI00209CBF85|nr:hypothetical protein [Lentzea sp. HUAS12]USX56251.1 hypothetical protein ND450_19760 [Lentzea sp. HUAS12]
MLTAIMAALCVVVVTAGNAQAIEERHFVKISTHSGAGWEAWGKLVGSDGRILYSWHEAHTGDYAYWAWTWRGANEHVEIKIHTYYNDITRTVPVNTNSCFLVTPNGGASYTGSGSGCTSA